MCPPIHTMSSESGSSRGNEYGVHVFVLPSKQSFTSCTVLQYIPMETFFTNTADSQAFVIWISTNFQIFDDEYAGGFPLLDRSSLVFVLRSHLLVVPTFDAIRISP